MKTPDIPIGSQRAGPADTRITEERPMLRDRLFAVLCAALGLAAAISAAWLIWQAPHCRAVPAHAYYTPIERCAR
jgi:hypothetical protein